MTLVHGFPQNWWMWHELIGPLVSRGYRVLCPVGPGAGLVDRMRDALTDRKA